MEDKLLFDFKTNQQIIKKIAFIDSTRQLLYLHTNPSNKVLLESSK